MAFKSLFKLLGWLRTLRQNFARVVSLIAFQHVSKHAGAAVIQCFTSGIKGPHTKTGKTENLHSIFFDFLVPFSGFRRHHVNIP